MQTQIGGVGFFEGNASISCQVATDNIRGHLDVIVSQEEYKEALFNDTLVDLATKHISAMVGEAAKVQQVKIEELQKELEKSKEKVKSLEMAQQQSNVSMVMMIAELENKIPKTEIENENNIDN